MAAPSAACVSGSSKCECRDLAGGQAGEARVRTARKRARSGCAEVDRARRHADDGAPGSVKMSTEQAERAKPRCR